MIEKLTSSYKSVMVLFDIIFNDFRNAYSRISNDYDLMSLVLFWIQLTAAVTIGGLLLMPSDKSDSGEFAKVWFVFGSILQFFSVVIFAIFFHFFMKFSNFNGRFINILKFSLAITILFCVVTLVFSFFGDLYLYSATDFFEHLKSDSSAGELLEYRIIYFIETYVMSVAFVILAISLFYISVHRSRTTLLCLASYAAFHALVLHPGISTIWTSFTCKRLDVCPPVEMTKDIQKALELEEYDPWRDQTFEINLERLDVEDEQNENFEDYNEVYGDDIYEASGEAVEESDSDCPKETTQHGYISKACEGITKRK